jgi:hypothetical protein
MSKLAFWEMKVRPDFCLSTELALIVMKNKYVYETRVNGQKDADKTSYRIFMRTLLAGLAAFAVVFTLVLTAATGVSRAESGDENDFEPGVEAQADNAQAQNEEAQNEDEQSPQAQSEDEQPQEELVGLDGDTRILEISLPNSGVLPDSVYGDFPPQAEVNYSELGNSPSTISYCQVTGPDADQFQWGSYSLIDHIFHCEVMPKFNRHPGTYNATVEFGYNGTGETTASTPISFTITPKPVTITGVTASNKVYNNDLDATPVSTLATIVGNIDGENLTIDTSTAEGAFSDKNVGSAKEVSFSGFDLGGPAASYYTLSEQPADATANIIQRAVLITGVGAENKTYDNNTDATPNSSSATIVGNLDDENLTIDSTTAAAVFSDKNVGVGKQVTFSGYSLSGPEASNYRLSSQPGTASANITPKPLTLTLGTLETTVRKYFEGNVVAPLWGDAGLDGVFSGDTVWTKDCSGAFTDDTSGDGKAITVTCALDGADKENYSVSPNSSFLTGVVMNYSDSWTGFDPYVLAPANSQLELNGDGIGLPTLTLPCDYSQYQVEINTGGDPISVPGCSIIHNDASVTTGIDGTIVTDEGIVNVPEGSIFVRDLTPPITSLVTLPDSFDVHFDIIVNDIELNAPGGSVINIGENTVTVTGGLVTIAGQEVSVPPESVIDLNNNTIAATAGYVIVNGITVDDLTDSEIDLLTGVIRTTDGKVIATKLSGDEKTDLDIIDALNVHNDDDFVVSGSGYVPGQEIRFELHSTPLLIGTTVAVDGSFRFEGKIPAGAELGDHHLVALDHYSKLEYTSAAVTISAKPILGETGFALNGVLLVSLLGMMFAIGVLNSRTNRFKRRAPKHRA